MGISGSVSTANPQYRPPVLAVKRKDHCMGVLDAIFNC